MIRFSILLVAALVAVATCTSSDQTDRVRDIRNRLNAKFAAGGRSGLATAAAAASGFGTSSSGSAGTGYAASSSAASGGNYYHQTAQQVPQGNYYHNGGGAAAAAAAYGNEGAASTAAAAQRVIYEPNPFANDANPKVEPTTPKPTTTQAPAEHEHEEEEHELNPYSGGYETGAAAAASGSMGAAAAVASTGAGNVQYYQPAEGNSYYAASGTYADGGLTGEESTIKKKTHVVATQENGKMDDAHYYQAQTYADNGNDNFHQAYNNNDDEYEKTRYGYRKRTKKENMVTTYNKSTSKTGSAVMAHDRNTLKYQKNTKNVHKKVKKNQKVYGDGLVENTDSGYDRSYSDGEEDFYDSDLGQQNHGASVASASSATLGGGAAAAASVAGH